MNFHPYFYYSEGDGGGPSAAQPETTPEPKSQPETKAPAAKQSEAKPPEVRQPEKVPEPKPQIGRAHV